MNITTTQVGRTTIHHPATLHPVVQGRQFLLVSAQRVGNQWGYTIKNDRGEYKDMTEAQYVKWASV